jgi:arylsulfatase
VDQFRTYLADVAPGRSAERGTLPARTGSSAAPMNGYPKIYNIESDPLEECNTGAVYE